MASDDEPVSTGTPRCNSRRKGHAGDLPKEEPGEWAGAGYCRNEAGHGTDHPGVGRCSLHGGSAVVKHGRYSTVRRQQLGEYIEQAEQDPDLVSCQKELAVVKGLLEDYLARDPEPDHAAVVGMASEISKIAKRIEDIRSQNAISVRDFKRLMSEIGRIVALHVDDEEILEDIRQDVRREVRL